MNIWFMRAVNVKDIVLLIFTPHLFQQYIYSRFISFKILPQLILMPPPR